MKSSLLPQDSSINSEPAAQKKEDIESDDEKILQDTPPVVVESQASILEVTPVVAPQANKVEIKALADIFIDLDNIQPSDLEPRIVLDEPGGIKIMLNFAKDHPSPDVNVIVITTINQGRESIKEFQFEASVRKPCKLRLLPASSTNLPGIKPFRPPSDGITQLLLLLNPTKRDVDLTCILTYCIGDDPDPVKESVIMKDIPYEC
jgi:ADP-ribosylation factor-binding protein GGA